LLKYQKNRFKVDISFQHPWQQTGVDLPKLAQIAALLAKTCQPGLAVGLDGTLGAGKTTLVQLLCQQLGVEDAVNSPSFGYLHTYQGAQYAILHADLYRAQPVDRILPELMDVIMAQTHLMLIEWANCWPDAPTYLTGTLTFEWLPDMTRVITYEVF
jgi:tRNA threonylcarbamoyladenosine biosynthesis protein TsaE